MCVETLITGLVFPRQLMWGVTCLGLLWKMNVFPSMSLRNPINVCWNPQNRACFSNTIDLKGHMPRFTWKIYIFPSMSFRNTINVCWNPQNRARFSKTIDCGVTCLGLLEKFTFSHLSPWKHNKCVLKPSEQGLFFWDNDLWGHMPRFTLKMNIFPSISLETPKMCVETLRTGLVFLRQSIWGVTCLGLLQKWMFSHLSPEKPHKCVLKPSEQCSFFQDNWFEGSHP